MEAMVQRLEGKTPSTSCPHKPLSSLSTNWDPAATAAHFIIAQSEAQDKNEWPVLSAPHPLRAPMLALFALGSSLCVCVCWSWEG